MCNVCMIPRIGRMILTDWSSGVGEAAWAFKTTFTATEGETEADNFDLVFDGLDTFAVVELVSVTSFHRAVCAC